MVDLLGLPRKVGRAPQGYSPLEVMNRQVWFTAALRHVTNQISGKYYAKRPDEER